MRKNQSGFTLFHVFLVVLVVGGIGAAGYYVWKQQTKEETPQTAITSFEECVAAGNPVMESHPRQCSADGQNFAEEIKGTEEPVDATTDWNESKGLGISLKYPQDWKQRDYENQHDSTLRVFFESPDWIPYSDEGGPSENQGYLLQVHISSPGDFKGFDEHLSHLKNTEQGCGGEYKTIEIDDLPAIFSDIKCHGTYTHATVYKNDKSYYFRLHSVDEDDPEHIKLFNNILSSVELD